MAQIEQNNRKSTFLASIFTLSAGSTLSQVITLALMPVITRLYDPEAFGVFAVFVAIATVIIGVSNLQLAEVVVIADDSEDADAGALLAALVVVVFSLTCGVLGFFFSDPLARVLGIAPYGFLLQLVSISVFLGGIRQIVRRWLLREHRNGFIAIGEVSHAIVDRLSTIGAFWVFPGTSLGLVVGRLLGQVAAVLSMLPPMFARPPSVSVSKPCRDRMRRLAHEHRNFPQYSWAILLDFVAQQLPVILINGLLGPAVAGGFALARRVLAEPSIVIGAALAQSFYQLAAREADRESLREVTGTMVFTLLKLVVLPIIIGLSAAPELFAIVFSESWRSTGWFSLIVSPVFMLYLVLRPLNRLFDVNRMQREKGIYALQNVALVVLAFTPALFTDNPYFVLAVYSCASTLFLGYRCSWLLGQVGISLRESYASCRLALLLAIGAGFGSILLRQALVGQDFAFVIGVILITLFYLLLLFFLDPKILALMKVLRRRRE